MKTLLYSKKMAFVFIAILFACLYACEGNDDELNLSNENLLAESRMNIAAYSDREIEVLSDKYATLFEGMYNDLLKEQARISNSGTNNSSEDYYTKRATNYMNRLTPQEQTLFSYMLNIESDIASEGAFFMKFVERIKSLIFVEDDSKLVYEINAFYNDENFKALDLASRQEIKLRLESLKKVRFVIVNGINEFILNENLSTRMSPGDRMIWSQSVSIMNKDHINLLVNFTLGGVGYVTAGKVITIVSMFFSLFC